MHKKLFIIAGEPSADLHGSHLIKAILDKSPDTKFIGMGGELMRSAGCKLFYDIKNISVVGFTEVIKKLPLYKKIFKELSKKLDIEKPDAVILIDYPGFNLKFAKQAKKRNIPVIYYISPQVWAWHKSRVKTIKKLVDKMLVLFEFEKDLYKQHGIDAVFVGHPLVDVVKTTMPKQDAIKHFGLKPDQRIIALLPGSRKAEVKKVLPNMLKAAEIIECRGLINQTPTQFILIKSPIVDQKVYDDIVNASLRAEHPVHWIPFTGSEAKQSPSSEIASGTSCPRNDGFVKIIDHDRYDAVSCADFALVASGTATLETAILGVPMALVYKVSFLTYLLARVLIKIPYIGLVNVVAGSKVIPEFIQFGASPKKIAAECANLLHSPAKLARMKLDLARVKASLGPPGASSRSAEEIVKFVDATA